MNTFCRYYNDRVCSSCQLIEHSYQAQLKNKEDTLSRRLNLPETVLVPSCPSPVHHFRHKAKLVVTGTMKNPLLGLLGEEDKDSGREILQCPLHHEEINLLTMRLPAFITEASLAPYHIGERKGELKGIIIFISGTTQEMYLRFVLRSKESVTRISKFLPGLLAHFPKLASVSVNIQPVPQAILEGKEEIFLTEQTFANHLVAGRRMRLDPRGFVQTNESVAQKLYQEAAEWVGEIKPDTFCELYSGQGAFSFAAADGFKKGLGLEINADAVASANESAQEAQLNHLSFKAADAEDVGEELLKLNPDLILVNPPRRGLGKASELIMQAGPDHLIYSSCSYESLARDLEELQKSFRVKRVKLFDMFPHTKHFETLVLLEKI